jgi:hypothetical protein
MKLIGQLVSGGRGEGSKPHTSALWSAAREPLGLVHDARIALTAGRN